MNTSNLFIYPLFAMFVLTVITLLRMFLTRVSAVKSGKVKMSYFRTYTQSEGPESMLKASRHFSNLFEVPVLFYVVTILGMLLHEGTAFLWLSWLYVVTRAVHAFIHMGYNNIVHRMIAYFLSWVALSAMWGLLLVHQI